MAARSRGDLTGKVALVTGAASGIGAATALALAVRVAHMACADFKPAAATLEWLRASGGSGCEITFDLADRGSVVRAVEKVAGEARGACLDILVCAAGIGFKGPLLAADADWGRVVCANLTATFATLRAAWPHL